ISFDSTGTLSFGQTYGRRRAVMQDAWSVVKERSLLSVAPYNLTGMFTRPNAIAPLHRARPMDQNLLGFRMKGHGALNDLSVALTLFKVDLPEDALGPNGSRIEERGPDPSSDGRPASREQIFRKSKAQLARGRVPIEGGHENALRGGPEESENEPVDDGNRRPYNETDDATDQPAQEEEQDAGKRE